MSEIESRRSAEEEEEEKLPTFYYVTYENKIEADNALTKELRRKQEAQNEMMRKAEQEKERAVKLQRDRENERQKEENDRIKAEIERRKHEELKRKEEFEFLQTVNGALAQLLIELKTNKTPLELPFSNLGYNSVVFRVLFKALEVNNSVRDITIARKNMSEEDGCDLAKSLQYNRSIERITLEGNLLGPKYLESLAETLRVNKTLKYIDLESNCLTKGNNERGIEALCEALKENDTLTSLNLNSASLTEKSAQSLKRALDYNHSLICLDLEMNPMINLKTMRQIQEKIQANQEKHRLERKYEWQQRKKMEDEQKLNKRIYMERKNELTKIKEIQHNAEIRQKNREHIFIEMVRKKIILDEREKRG